MATTTSFELRKKETTMKLYFSILNAMQTAADRERGAAMPEYGLLVALIAVVALAAVTTVGTGVSDSFTGIAGSLN